LCGEGAGAERRSQNRSGQNSWSKIPQMFNKKEAELAQSAAMQRERQR
jgi:hypothetical protein